MYIHTLGASISTPGGSLPVTQKQYQGAAISELQEDIPIGVDTPLAFTLDVSAVKSFVAMSTVDVTVETNDGTTPGSTLALKAGVPYVWNSDSYDTFKLTVDVTSLFVTNGGAAAGILYIRALTDPTP